MMTLQRTSTLNDQPYCTVIVMSKVVRHGEDGVGFVFVPVDTASANYKDGPGATAADRRTLDRFLELLEDDQGCVSLGLVAALALLLSLASHWTRDAAMLIASAITLLHWPLRASARSR